MATRKIVLLAVAGVALSGCVFQRMDTGLRNLVGQDIHAAVNAIGYPNGQRQILGDTIYVWSTRSDATFIMPTTSTTAGMVGNVPIYGTTTSYQAVSGTYACTIEIAVDASNRIKRYEWKGNVGGCSSYANRLANVPAASVVSQPIVQLKADVRCKVPNQEAIGFFESAAKCDAAGGTVVR